MNQSLYGSLDQQKEQYLLMMFTLKALLKVVIGNEFNFYILFSI